MSRISKRDENVKKLGTSSQNGSSGDASPSPPAIPTSQANNHNEDDLNFLLNVPTADLERIINKFIVDTNDLVDPSSEHAQLGSDPSLEHGSKQAPIRSCDQDPCLPTADPGVAYEPSSANEIYSKSPLSSPLFSPIDLPQPDVTEKPQASSTPIPLAPCRAREEVQVTETSVPWPPQPSIHDDASSTTAVAGPTTERSRPASVQGLLPVCALDIDFLSAKPRASSAPLLAPVDSSSPQAQNASSVHEVQQIPTGNSSSARTDRQKRKSTGSAMSKDRRPSFTTYIGLSGNVPLPSSADPGSSTNRMLNSQWKQTLEEVGIPVTPAPFLEGSAPTTIAASYPFLSQMSETEKQELAKVIETAIQTTGLLSSPKDLISRSRRQKRKRDKNTEATTSTTGPDAPQPTIPEQTSTSTAPLIDDQEAPGPKPKRKRTSKPKKDRPIVANPYPRTTTTPPDVQQVQGIRTDTPPAPMPLVNPSSMAPMNVPRSNGGFDSGPSLAVHGNTFPMNSLVDTSAFQPTQSTSPGSTPYSFNVPGHQGVNHPQGIIPGAVHPARPAYNPAFMNSQRLFWQRAQIAREIQARRQAGFTDQRYRAPLIPNAMSMPVANEGSWNPRPPNVPSQLLTDAGLPYFFDSSQSTHAASGQPRTRSNAYPQYQVPSFDHNIQSDPYHMQHPLFNQALAGPSHPLQPDFFNPPAFNAQLMPPTGYESQFPPIHFGRETQRDADYVTRPAVPAIRAPIQNYPHGLNPSFVNHAVAPINLPDNPTTRGQISATTSSRMRPTLPAVGPSSATNRQT